MFGIEKVKARIEEFFKDYSIKYKELEDKLSTQQLLINKLLFIYENKPKFSLGEAVYIKLKNGYQRFKLDSDAILDFNDENNCYYYKYYIGDIDGPESEILSKEEYNNIKKR